MVYKWIGFVMLILTLSSCGSEDLPFVWSVDTKMTTKDSVQFSSPDYDDSHWPETISQDSMDRIFWVRMPLELDDGFMGDEMAIEITATFNYKVFWNGQYLGKNGEFFTDDSEPEYGQYIKVYPIPHNQLKAGDNLVALRVSADAVNYLGHHAIAIVTTLDNAMAGPIRFSLWLFIFIGVFLTVCTHFAFLYFYNPKEWSYLIFSLICLTVIALLGFEYVKHTYPYSFPFQAVRMQVINALHIVLALLVPFFLMLQFKVPKKWLLLLLILFSAYVINKEESFDMAAKMQNNLMWISSMCIMAYAILKQRKEAYILLVALILSYTAHYITRQFRYYHVAPYDVGLFVEYLILALSMVYMTNYHRKQERLAYEQSLITSERLRSELLRKNIRPHFIMNTLTSLMDWVEESPQQGVRFIKSLASEFRLINDMADEQLIPIQKEIDICKHHLEVMGYRKDIKYLWQEENIHYGEMIPPAILLTMVENGVTHSHGEGLKEVAFYLKYRIEDNWKVYTLTVHTDVPINICQKVKDESTGTKYITSRLQESYGEDWSYHAGPSGDHWENTVKIRVK